MTSFLPPVHPTHPTIVHLYVLLFATYLDCIAAVPLRPNTSTSFLLAIELELRSCVATAAVDVAGVGRLVCGLQQVEPELWCGPIEDEILSRTKRKSYCSLCRGDVRMRMSQPSCSYGVAMGYMQYVQLALQLCSAETDGDVCDGRTTDRGEEY